MVLYEANFIKLRQLVEQLESFEGTAVSRAEQDCDLHLCITDRTRYTAGIKLTYWFADGNTPVAEPDLHAKVYFDARMVEVRGWTATHRHEILRELGQQCGRPLDVCWSRNIMLSKWLDYLLEQGHVFSRNILVTS